MTIDYNQLGRIGFFDHRRMIEDLSHTFGHLATSRDAIIRPPASMLTRLGQDLLCALPEDRGAYDLRYGVTDISIFSDIEYGTAFSGGLSFDCMQAAIVLGRLDLRLKFVDDAGFDFDKALRWYVLHGVREHGLWHSLKPKFIKDLRRPSIVVHGGHISPLCAIVIGERPELIEQFEIQGAKRTENMFIDWCREQGTSEYDLAWAGSEEDQRRQSFQIRNRCRNRSDSRSDGASIGAAHADTPAADLKEVAARVNDVRQKDQGRPWVLTHKEDGIAQLIVRGGVGDVDRYGVPFYSSTIKMGIPKSKNPIHFAAIQLSNHNASVKFEIDILNEGKIVGSSVVRQGENIIIIPVLESITNLFNLSYLEIHCRSETHVVRSSPWAHLRRVWFF